MYSYDALKVLEEVWMLDGEPCGKYLVPVMDDLLERLLRFKLLVVRNVILMKILYQVGHCYHVLGPKLFNACQP